MHLIRMRWDTFLFNFFGIICFSLAGFTPNGEAQHFIPSQVNWRSNPDASVDLSPLLDAPAGKSGFITIQNGHFVKANGKRLKIWGINVSSKACFPRKEDAADVAAYLARHGINGVRFHHMDNRGTGFLDGEPDTTQKLNAELLDRLDFFIAALKKRGIYVNLNLNVARQYKPGDGVRDAEYLGYAKAATYFNPRLIALQKEYARQLLTHYNPYTESEYRHEPAVIIVEIVNENSLVEAWFAGRLQGKNTRKYPGTWTDLPASYAQELDRFYNRWLKQHYSPDRLKEIRQEAQAVENGLVPRLTPKQFPKTATPRFRAEAAFYMDTERRFMEQMVRFLKKDLDIKAAVVGSSDHNHWRSGYPHLTTNNGLDVIDGHVYWQHPKYLEGRTQGRRNFSIPNTPMVNDPFFSTVVQLSRTAIAGKPYTVSETNHPYPNEYACEGVPILAAYACLQDWDGIFFYTLEHSPPDQWSNRMSGHFDFRPHPVKMSGIATAALTFLRSDVHPARQTIFRSYSTDQVIESILLPTRERPFFTPGFPLANPLIHATRIHSFNATPSKFEKQGQDTVKKIKSDTGELTWSIEKKDRGMVTIDTPKTQALIGFVGDHAASLKHLAARVENTFCAIQLVSLDNQPIQESKSMLLTTTGNALNQHTQWNVDHTSLLDWGEGEMQVEIIAGEIILQNLSEAENITLHPLDANHRQIKNASVPATKKEGKWHLPLQQSLMYIITVE